MKTPVDGPIDVNQFPESPDLALGLDYENDDGKVELIPIDDVAPDVDTDPVFTSKDEDLENQLFNSLKYIGLLYKHEPAHGYWDPVTKKWKLLTGRTRLKCYKKLGAKLYPMRKVKKNEKYSEEELKIALRNQAFVSDCREAQREMTWIAFSERCAEVMNNNKGWFIGQPKLMTGEYDYSFDIFLMYFKSESIWLGKWGDEKTSQNFPKKIYNRMMTLVTSGRKISKKSKETINQQHDKWKLTQDSKSDIRLVNINDPVANGTYYGRVLLECFDNEQDLVLNLHTSKDTPSQVDRVRNDFTEKVSKTVAKTLQIAYNQLGYKKEKVWELVKEVHKSAWSKLQVNYTPAFDNEGDKPFKVNISQFGEIDQYKNAI
jgi:hypothetical protein